MASVSEVVFRNRTDAGRQLAEALTRSVAGGSLTSPVVLALPRGGVPVAFEVARKLGAPLDVILVRKLGAPGRPELAMGAIGERDVRVLNPSVLHAAGVSQRTLARIEGRERTELERRAALYRSTRAPVELAGHDVVIVDDGLATGATARAAIAVARAGDARRVVLAVPIAPPDVAEQFATIADAVVTVETPARLWAIGSWYADFTQTGDDEVQRLLRDATAWTSES
jgi:putative phosphoribosyl transferase